nr:hypothetical protein HmN_000890100 [Hymenolepis microstoma]
MSPHVKYASVVTVDRIVLLFSTVHGLYATGRPISALTPAYRVKVMPSIGTKAGLDPLDIAFPNSQMYPLAVSRDTLLQFSAFHSLVPPANCKMLLFLNESHLDSKNMRTQDLIKLWRTVNIQ